MSLGFKAAHKQVKVREQDQGLLLFEFADSFTATWCVPLRSPSFLSLLVAASWSLAAAYRAPATCPAAPQSLAIRLATGPACDSVCLPQKTYLLEESSPGRHPGLVRLEVQLPVRDRVAEQIQALLSSKKVNKKALQSCLGLLNWATSISHHLRSYTAPLYSDLNSPPGTLYNIPACVWQRFLFSLDNRAVVTRTIPGLHISASARVMEVGSLRVRRRSEFLFCPIQTTRDPTASEIALTKESKGSLAWLLSCVQSTPTKPLSVPHLLHCLSAADAMAEGDTVGIGGWLCAKDGLHWFSEVWSMSHVREVWPQLHKDAQKYIACFETLAQLALLQMAHSRLLLR